MTVVGGAEGEEESLRQTVVGEKTTDTYHVHTDKL